MSTDTLTPLKSQLIEYVQNELGEAIVSLELDPAHYETAYQKTLGTYRQRAQNAYEESYSFLALEDGVSIYTLPQEVTTVRQIFRRAFGLGSGQGGGSAFDPFGAAAMNVYLLNAGEGQGGLATYDFYQQYVELAARMFGGYMNYTYNSVSKKLQLIRDPRGSGEEILLWTYNAKPEITLLSDFQISQWFKDYMTNASKHIIGEAREKFSSIAGPQGGSVLNGSAMKAEARAGMDQCVLDLKEYVDGSEPLTFVIG